MGDNQQRSEQTHQGRAMELEMRTSASPMDVWNAWADPKKIAQWFADDAENWAHKGNQVTWIFDEFGYRLPYEVIESIPGERLVFGGELPGRPPFLLEIRLERDSGETVVKLINSGFLEGGNFDEEYEGVVSGWTLALAMLKYYVEEHYGKDKKTILVTREADVDLSQLLRWYTEPESTNKWLSRSLMPANAIVAGVTKREIAKIWPHKNTFFELKGWGAGDKKFVAIRITCWDADERFMEDARSEAVFSLDRLVKAAGTGNATGQ